MQKCLLVPDVVHDVNGLLWWWCVPQGALAGLFRCRREAERVVLAYPHLFMLWRWSGKVYVHVQRLQDEGGEMNVDNPPPRQTKTRNLNKEYLAWLNEQGYGQEEREAQTIED